MNKKKILLSSLALSGCFFPFVMTSCYNKNEKYSILKNNLLYSSSSASTNRIVHSFPEELKENEYHELKPIEKALTTTNFSFKNSLGNFSKIIGKNRQHLYFDIKNNTENKSKWKLENFINNFSGFVLYEANEKEENNIFLYESYDIITPAGNDDTIKKNIKITPDVITFHIKDNFVWANMNFNIHKKHINNYFDFDKSYWVNDGFHCVASYCYPKKIEKNDWIWSFRNKEKFFSEPIYIYAQARNEIRKIFNELKNVDKVNIQFSGKLFNVKELSNEFSKDEFQNKLNSKLWTNNDDINKLLVNEINFRITRYDKVQVVHNKGNKKYEDDFNEWRNKLQNLDSVNIESDMLNDWSQKISGESRSKSNYERLKEFIDEKNMLLENNSFKLVWGYSNSNSQNKPWDPKKIDILLRSKNNEPKIIDLPLISNLPVYLTESQLAKDIANKKDIDNRLKIIFGKWVDFQNGTTKLVDDIKEKHPEDNKHIGLAGNEFWLGKWIVHSPAKVTFRTIDKENEALFINGKKIDVLNKNFLELLEDKRKNASDDGREFNAGYKNKEDEKPDKNNSHKKNEYIIEVKKYSKPGNLDSDLEVTYKMILVINSRSSQMDFKWYGWDPSNNPHQQELLDEYLMDSKKEYKKDDKGEPIKNPKYDPTIDPATGTRKQLVWVDMGVFKNKSMFFKTGGISNFSHYYSDEKQKNYYMNTLLPYNAKTLFAPHKWEDDLDRGFIAEAIVLNKGGVKSIIGDVENFTMFKLEKDQDNNLYFAKIDNRYYKELPKQTSEQSYFSEAGIYLFSSNAKNSISNFKLVYVTGTNSEKKKYFTNNVITKNNFIAPLSSKPQGRKFINFLIKEKDFNKEELNALKYEDAMEYYKEYIDRLYENAKYSDKFLIDAKFKDVPSDIYTSDEFANKYFNNLEDFKRDFYIAPKEKYDGVDVKIRKLEFDKDKAGIKIYLNLDTVQAWYELKQDVIFKEVKFKDITTSKKIINLIYDSVKVNTIFESSVDVRTFIVNLMSKTTEIFGITSEQNDKLDFKFLHSESNNKINLIINVKLKEKFKDYSVQPKSEFSQIFNKDDLNKNANVDIGIFKDITLNEINLKGLNNKEKIKNYITSKVVEATKKLNLTLDKDFKINWGNVLEDLINPQIEADGLIVKSSILSLEAINKSGIHKITITNTAGRIFEKEIDLSTYMLDDFEINENKLSQLKKRVREEIQSQFDNLDEKLVIGRDIKIENYNDGINYLALGNRTSFEFIITSLNNMIVNKTKVKVTNIAPYVIDDIDPNNPNKRYLYDLNILSINDLKYNEYIGSQLRDKIIEDVENSIKQQYNISNKYYSINIKELDDIVRKLIQRSKVALNEKLTIYSVDGLSQGTFMVNIINHNKDKKPVDDLDKTSINSKKLAAQKKKMMLIFIPLCLILGVVIGLLVWYFYLRKKDNKVR
ncbi:hypothetical protein NPA07_03225 [Mycoplasmopsis caviae]|uniref:Lipoprotein n=1 Tax=Mycoplasmopsis caviae TaxID=55603 RepID=A0A3P8KAE3_9BACT|nr:hypothetical protein [Mycoplasmopsis caviae]UUD34808.1 hypothetical protein NPA07_03225 [Mycoplasmopsis caviae]VDR42339.1 Uncharacterised protein [Mycoplasmopsis caviae]